MCGEMEGSGGCAEMGRNGAGMGDGIRDGMGDRMGDRMGDGMGDGEMGAMGNAMKDRTDKI